MKIFDLNKSKNYKKENLQKNINSLKKEYGNKFLIKYKKFNIPVKFQVKQLKFKNLKYLCLKYDIEKQIEYLLPFMINFIDNDTYELNNNVYIANIHKINEISGTQMIEFVLKLLEVLGVNMASLYDAASVKCDNNNMQLSFFKLIEKKRGFYEKFGFKLSSQINNYGKKQFPNNEIMHNLLYDTIDKFKTIKLDYYKNIYIKILEIFLNIIKNQDYHKLEIGILEEIDIQNENNMIILYVENKIDEVFYIIKDINRILEIIKNTKQKLLYKFMIETFNDSNKCQIYLDIMCLIIDYKLYSIKYKNKIIKLDNLYLFRTIKEIQNMTRLYYYF